MYEIQLPPVSNRADWIETIEVRDGETNELVDLTGASITLHMRQEEVQTPILTATSAAGAITFPSVGTFQWRFDDSAMKTIEPGLYEVGCVAVQNGVAVQLFTGTIEVVDGVQPQ